MFGLVKFLFVSAISLVFLIPAALVLAVVGLPIAAVLGVLALPVLIVLFIVGLPIFLVLLVVGAVACVLFGVLGAFVGLTIGAIKLVLFAVLPVALVAWVLMRVIGGRRVHAEYVWPPARWFSPSCWGRGTGLHCAFRYGSGSEG